jgi:hypothetical protein
MSVWPPARISPRSNRAFLSEINLDLGLHLGGTVIVGNGVVAPFFGAFVELIRPHEFRFLGPAPVAVQSPSWVGVTVGIVARLAVGTSDSLLHR